MSAPGSLNRRLMLEAPSDVDDGAGGVSRSYAIVTTLWANVVPVTGVTDVEADRSGGLTRYRITVRRRGDITTRHRFQDGDRIYSILAIRESADRRFTVIDADALQE